MSKSDGPKFVTALFSFKGKNNDELCFKKGDLITITQTDDGGWWEGTLNEKTGWFPSNYVKEFRTPGTSLQSFSFSDSESGSTPTKVSPEKSSPDSPIHQTLNRDIVLKDIIDSEHANVAELQGLVGNFLQPLEAANILKKEEYKQLIGNIHEVLETHQRLLANLNGALPQGPEARIGNIFLTLASKIKSIHTNYCNCHPQAVCILDHYRDELNEFMERTGAITPGILVLTTGLSKPFRRLDKYSAMLQELERHTEKNHPDRGDTQRSVSVYREIANRCAAVRKQRELALQILTSGIKGWEGEELNVLGDIIHVGPVILASGVDRRDRYFVLFPSTLLVLSTSARMSSFVYEGKLPLTGITVLAIEQCDDYKNAFEIFGPMIENITVLCPSREERQHWIELLSLHEQSATSTRGSNLGRSPTNVSHSSSQSLKLQAAGADQSPTPGIKAPWSLASLRPAPPIYALKTFRKLDTVDACRSMKTCNERQFEEDAIILRVIEGYCLSANARFTVNSAMLDFDLLHKVNDRESFMHSRIGNWDTYDDRSLSETVKALKSQMSDLQLQVMQLCKQLEDERKSRLSLAATVKRSMAIMDSVVP
ncbi:PREDICTED: rho guanine nucleotide exchange factor 7 isoform X2 [Ceratosolen solmsi marchali]|uniref:Rho guanine nucleotide exchange factor 7 isoform X2 n=1 Tax=Ceratosolen solmsi marchali TaxID=326594 RepID=A0AAJ6YD04_9HYME|nr:PREDICTED: rho guanine nucleotide exchange factor 7 isoform X2 [Ceratosolen solmsi marchali]